MRPWDVEPRNSEGQAVIRLGKEQRVIIKRMSAGALPSNGGCTRAAASTPGSDGGTSVDVLINAN